MRPQVLMMNVAITPLLIAGCLFNSLAVAAPGPAYARRPYVLVDQVKPGSSFSQFREQLRQAVRDRNAGFIRAIADPRIQLGYGRPRPLSSLDINNPQAPFWLHLERVLSVDCAPYEAPPGATVEAWACPHVFQAALGDPFADVYIVGEGINVRSQPRLGSPVVDGVSNEVVKVDQAALNAFSQSQLKALQTLAGWYPVITPAGQRGYVSSRYAFIPAGFRAIFERQGTRWKMTAFLAGD